MIYNRKLIFIASIVENWCAENYLSLNKYKIDSTEFGFKKVKILKLKNRN